jgi:nicotinamide mononucleotide (NMN) deamidase PncC
MPSSRIARLLHSLHKLALPVVTAESCTSGLLASSLTSRPNAPSVLLGGVTSYSPLFKARALGVPAAILDTARGGPGDVSRECAAAMARGALAHSGLLEPDEERQFKFGVLLERAQGVGVSTTGFLDAVPDGTDAGRVGECYVGVRWLFKERADERVVRVDVGDVRGTPDTAQHQDQDDADREARKHAVVDRAIGLLEEVVGELERAEGGQQEEKK